MGFIGQGGKGSVTWANVADGTLRVGDKTFGGFSGYITGIRTKQNIYNNKETTKLEIRMVPPENHDDAVIISGTLYNNDGTVTTWGKMIVARLVKTGNPGPGELVELGVYAAGESRATCASLRRPGDATALQGDERIKEASDNPSQVRALVEGFVRHLATLYPWAQGEPAGSDNQEQGGGWHASQRGSWGRNEGSGNAYSQQPTGKKNESFFKEEEAFPDDGLPF